MPSIIDMPAATHLTIAVYLDLACAYYAYTSPFIHASLQPRLEWGQAETVRRNYERPRFHEAAVFDCVRLLGKYGLYFRGEHEYVMLPEGVMYVRSPSPRRGSRHGEESSAATAEVHSPRSITSTTRITDYFYEYRPRDQYDSDDERFYDY
jgi:hypothetical protein